MKAKISFTSPLNSINLNKVLCYFTKNINTEVIYVMDIEGNSCHDKAVKNLYFSYQGQTFTSENSVTNIYVVTNPYLTSDPAPTGFLNMYTSSNELSSASLTAALNGFAITYLSSTYLGSADAFGMTGVQNPGSIEISFD